MYSCHSTHSVQLDQLSSDDGLVGWATAHHGLEELLADQGGGGRVEVGALNLPQQWDPGQTQIRHARQVNRNEVGGTQAPSCVIPHATEARC